MLQLSPGVGKAVGAGTKMWDDYDSLLIKCEMCV